MNQLILYGHICQDPKLTKFDDGKTLCTFNLAVNRPYKNSKTNEYDTDFFPITTWEGIASAVATHCKKGSAVVVQCRVQSRKATIEQVNLTVHDFIAELVTFTGTPSKTSEN